MKLKIKVLRKSDKRILQITLELSSNHSFIRYSKFIFSYENKGAKAYIIFSI